MSQVTLLFIGLLLTPALAVALPQSKAKAATHSTSGVVQSVNDTTLVVAKVGKNAGKNATETFQLNTATVKHGEVVVGAKVGVRYVTDGGQNVATAITVAAKNASNDIPKSDR